MILFETNIAFFGTILQEDSLTDWKCPNGIHLSAL